MTMGGRGRGTHCFCSHSILACASWMLLTFELHAETAVLIVERASSLEQLAFEMQPRYTPEVQPRCGVAEV